MHPLIWLLRAKPAGIQRGLGVVSIAQSLLYLFKNTRKGRLHLVGLNHRASVLPNCLHDFLQKGSGFEMMMKNKPTTSFPTFLWYV